MEKNDKINLKETRYRDVKNVVDFLKKLKEKNEKYKVLLKTKPNLKTDDKEKIKKWKDEFTELFNSP